VLGFGGILPVVATKNLRMVGGSTLEFKPQLVGQTPCDCPTRRDWSGSIQPAGPPCPEAGDDPSGLGHWSWIRLKGQGTLITQVIAVYHPCFLDGPLSTYQQHCQGLMQNNQCDCPCKAILADLQTKILAWQEAGDSIILLTDFNKDVCLP